MDYLKEIAELKEKINANRSEHDLDKNELFHREVRNELVLKRDQILHLKKELQEANLKVFELSRELENTKSLLKESTFNLKLALQKSAKFEKKLAEINEGYINLKLKEEMKLSEIESLKESIQNVSLQNHQLLREVDELQHKTKYSRALHDDLEQRQTKINAIIAKTKSSVESLQNEQQQITEFGKYLQSINELKNRTLWLTEENEKLRKSNVEMENSLIENSAKYDKLCTLIKNNNKFGLKQPILGQIKFFQWESHWKKLQQKNTNNEEIIRSLTTSLNEEIETNVQLILENEKYEARILELENQIPKVAVKAEPTDIIRYD